MSDNISQEMNAGKPQKQAIAIAYNIQRKNKKKKMADGGEVRAASSMPNEDEMQPRSMAMLDGHEHESSQELVANDESMAGNSIDRARTARDMAIAKAHSEYHDARVKLANGGEIGDEGAIDADSEDAMEMDMLHKRKMAFGGEVDMRDESMAENSIDDAASERDENMLDSKPRRHSPELRANDEHHVDEDDQDDMEMGMLHSKAQPDEYSKNGLINYAKGGMVDNIMKKRRMADGGEVDLDHNSDTELNNEDQMSFDAARKRTYYDAKSQMEDQPMDSNEHGDDLKDEDEHDMVDSIRKKMKSKRS